MYVLLARLMADGHPTKYDNMILMFGLQLELCIGTGAGFWNRLQAEGKIMGKVKIVHYILGINPLI